MTAVAAGLDIALDRSQIHRVRYSVGVCLCNAGIDLVSHGHQERRCIGLAVAFDKQGLEAAERGWDVGRRQRRGNGLVGAALWTVGAPGGEDGSESAAQVFGVGSPDRAWRAGEP